MQTRNAHDVRLALVTAHFFRRAAAFYGRRNRPERARRYAATADRYIAQALLTVARRLG